MSGNEHARTGGASESQPTYRVWCAEGAEYHPRRTIRIRHSFSSHPLLTVSALHRLGEKFRAQGNHHQIKFVRKGTTSGDKLDPLSYDESRGSLSEVFSRIEEPGSWVSLYHVQTDPEYAEMLRAISTTVAGWQEALDPGAFDWAGFIFVSSPPSATPFHIDRENNFFLQIHGKKRMSVWDPADRHVVPESAIEDRMAHGANSNVHFDTSFFQRAIINDELGPGEGVYMPSTSGHTTNTEAKPAGPDDTYSVSIGVNFYTKATRRAGNNYALNYYLRRLGMNPRSPYESPALDKLKYPVARSLVLAKKYFRGFEIPPGM